MLSGLESDILDSQESIFKNAKTLTDIPDSEGSFSDLWDVSTGLGNALLPELNDLNTCRFENVSEHEDILNPQLSSFSNVIEEKPENESTSTSQSNVNVCTDVDQFSSASINTLTDFPGPYKFRAHCLVSAVFTSSVHFTYSHSLNTLFLKMKSVCPFEFSCDLPLPRGCIVRAVLYYKAPQHFPEHVSMCFFHSCSSCEDEQPAGHILQLSEQDAIYGLTQDGRNCVSMPLHKTNEVKPNSFIARFKFACSSSCHTGINRRRVALVFLLESANGQALGRHVMEVRICSRPLRDRYRAENKIKVLKEKGTSKRSRTGTNSSSIEKLPEVNLESDDDDKMYIMHVRGRKKFKRLLSIKQAFDLEEFVSDEQRKEYLSKETSFQNC